MAGDWIKMEVATLSKPEVLRMAALIDVPIGVAGWALLRVWAHAQEHTTSGRLEHADAAFIDYVGQLPGLARAMVEVGWLIVEKSQVVFPQWDRHNGNGAKKRAMDARRASRSYHARPREVSRSDARKSGTRARASKEQEQEQEDKSACSEQERSARETSACCSLLLALTDRTNGHPLFNAKAAHAIAKRIDHDEVRVHWGVERFDQETKSGNRPRNPAAWIRTVIETVEPPPEFRAEVRRREMERAARRTAANTAPQAQGA